MTEWESAGLTFINSNDCTNKVHMSFVGLIFTGYFWITTSSVIFMAADMVSVATASEELQWMEVSALSVNRSGEWMNRFSSGSISTAQWSFEFPPGLPNLEKPVGPEDLILILSVSISELQSSLSADKTCYLLLTDSPWCWSVLISSLVVKQYRVGICQHSC